MFKLFDSVSILIDFFVFIGCYPTVVMNSNKKLWENLLTNMFMRLLCTKC